MKKLFLGAMALLAAVTFGGMGQKTLTNLLKKIKTCRGCQSRLCTI